MADDATKPEVDEEEVDEEEVDEEEVDEDDEPIAFSRHAMFPRDDDGPETRDVVWIQLLRMLPNGTVQTCPDQFRATELPHWGEVYRRFGGGKYRAKGRNAKMQWQAESPGGSDWHVFDGASKPFAVNPVEVPSAPAPAAPIAPAAPALPPASSGPTVAEALVALSGVISSVATALISRPAPPPPPAPDNTLAVAMMNNMAAQSQASAKATSDVLVALLSKDDKQDNSSLVAVLNASAETTRAQAAAQNTLLTAVLSQKQPGLGDLADVLAKLGRGAPQPAGGIKDTIEAIKAVREISAPAQAPGGGELGDVTSLVTSLAALDKGGGSKEREPDTTPPPKPRRNRILVRTAMGLVEVVDPSPELLRQLAAPTVGAAPAPAVAAPTSALVAAPVAVITAPPPAPTAPRAPAVSAPPAPMPPAPSSPAPLAPPSTVMAQPAIDAPAPLSDEEELAQFAAKLKSDPQKSARLAQLLRDAPAEVAEAVAAPTHEPAQQDRRGRSRRRSVPIATPAQEQAPCEPAAPQEPTPPCEPPPVIEASAPQTAPPQEPTAPPPSAAAEPGRTIVVGGMEVTVVQAGEAPAEPIQLPQSFETPPEAGAQISDEVMTKLTKMKADEIETLVRKKLGAKADGIAEAIKALPPEALPFALKMFPPDALRALAAGSL